MLQVVAGLTVVFVGYVLYEVYKTVSSESKSGPQAKVPPPSVGTATRATPAATPTAGTAGKSTTAPEPKKAATSAKKSEPVAEPRKSEPPEEQKALQLKDPATGETGPAPTNYRFAKKWIKEALVAEGLLDKVYKNADLDEAAGRKVREALDTFKAMTKYHA
jgi:hypothetical protein